MSDFLGRFIIAVFIICLAGYLLWRESRKAKVSTSPRIVDAQGVPLDIASPEFLQQVDEFNARHNSPIDPDEREEIKVL